jgi:tetratricopeptide (TPR) repeat protein
VPSHSRPTRAPAWAAGLLLGSLLPQCSRADDRPDPALDLDREIVAAETALRENEREIAESHYRSALLEGFLLIGSLEAAGQRLPEARAAFERASGAAVETRRALESLALVLLQSGEPGRAVDVLARVVARNPKDLDARRLLVQARIANGQPEAAVQDLEEARAAAPDDLELAFMLATGYLRLKKPEAAAPLLARIAKERPIPQTHVLIGRAYRDAGEYDRARAELQEALKLDPKVRRAHYYLGMVGVLDQGVAKLEEAIGEFEQELKLAPEDPLTNLRLGMALVEAQRPEAALPHLELAVRAEPVPADAFHYLGRCQLALERPADARVALARALQLAESQDASESQLGSIHYQLGLACRKLGEQPEAAGHFAAAERYSAERAESTRERLARYLAGSAEPDAKGAGGAPAIEGALLNELTSAERQELKRRVTAALARTYLNLGVMHAQAERFARAAELFEEAAALDPDFPQLQYSLGVAHFNARHFPEATGPLTRALAARPADASLARMLAIAFLNSEDYAKAAALLADDRLRESDPSLQYAYGLALVRSERADEAQHVFSRLLAEHGDSPQLSVVIGQAYAQQGDYEAATQSLLRALARKPDVPEANATLGVLYLKQGKLPEAEQALGAELKLRPDDLKTRHNLATVLDLEGRPAEALPLLRAVLKAKPDFVDARYLLGKILLAQGSALEAVAHLEAAARLASEDANIHYQLGQAYQKTGRPELAQQQFERFRELKEKRRGATP